MSKKHIHEIGVSSSREKIHSAVKTTFERKEFLLGENNNSKMQNKTCNHNS